MKGHHTLSLILNAHLPFLRHSESPRFLEERSLFEAITETYLPLLRVFERLDAERIPFRIAMSFSPTLCRMMQDRLLIDRFLEFLDRRIEFGSSETKRTAADPAVLRLATRYYDRSVEDRVLFTERYERDLLRAFDFYHKKGRIELLTSAATYAFLPLYMSYPESIQAQIEVAITSHRAAFGRNSQGFWLPELGWYPGLDKYLRAYNFNYTVVEAHGLVHALPAPAKGTFAPVRTSSGLVVFGRDFYATEEICNGETGYPMDPVYRDFHHDIGYDLPAEQVSLFLGKEGTRTPTGFKYWAVSKSVYDADAASLRAREHARAFLDARTERLATAESLVGEKVHSLCSYNADQFGHCWYEGPQFLEGLFREAAGRDDVRFVNPSEYLSKADISSFQIAMPEFSSWGANGFAEPWLDSSNDWLYRHVLRSLSRMIELSERFPDDGGIKERALNQAAREVLLTQSSDWAGILRQHHGSEDARKRVEEGVKNFTTIYESLGSNYISTEWLTNLERRHNIFPEVNYRVFRRKR